MLQRLKAISRVEEILGRTGAFDVVARHKKHADLGLYKTLAACLEICEVCQRDKKELAVLDRLISELPILNGRNRQYVEKGSDIYQRTCRYVFHGDEHTANINRYAICIREAAKQKISSETITETLTKSGGINRFFLQRPDTSPVIATKCLRLDRQISHHKSETIILKLRRNKTGGYRVLDCELLARS